MRIHNIYITKSIDAASAIKKGLVYKKDNVIDSGCDLIYVSKMVPPYMKDQYEGYFVAFSIEEVLNDTHNDEWNYIIC